MNSPQTIEPGSVIREGNRHWLVVAVLHSDGSVTRVASYSDKLACPECGGRLMDNGDCRDCGSLIEGGAQ